ncbi:MAG: F0F1 ATP synthase subunit beta, partial [Clostridia bacterium]|nr:F0F1 ATP synthase subunit beta [Clostridia bacterium]
MSKGKIVQVIGPVVDVEFPQGQLPDIYHAVTVKNEEKKINLTMEAAQHLGNNVVRCIAMSSTDGLQRGIDAENTGEPIKVPVGRETLG